MADQENKEIKPSEPIKLVEEPVKPVVLKPQDTIEASKDIPVKK